MNVSYITSAGSVLTLYFFLRGIFWEHYILIRGLHGLKTEARTRPVPEIVWPNPTRPERHG